MISSRQKAPAYGGGLLLVDGTDTTVHRKAEFAFTPSRKAAYALDRLLGLRQETYNAALQERRDAWRHPSQTKVTTVDQFLQLTDLREERPEVFQFGLQPIRSAIKRVDEAYTAFFDRVRNGQTSGFPRFKSRKRYDTAGWDEPTSWQIKTVTEQAKRNAKGRADVKDRAAGKGGAPEQVFLVIQGVGQIRLTRSAVRQLRRLESRGGVRVTLTVTRHARGHRKPDMVPDPQQVAGLDRGVAVTAAVADGHPTPRLARHGTRGRPRPG